MQYHLYATSGTGMYFKKRASYIYLGLKNILIVVCFAPSLLIFSRQPQNWCAASTKSSASVQTSRLFSSSIRHTSIISLRHGGTTSESSESESESISLPLAKPTFTCTIGLRGFFDGPSKCSQPRLAT